MRKATAPKPPSFAALGLVPFSTFRLVEIGRRIVERLEPTEIFPLVTRSVNRLLGTHFCVLMLREGDHLVYQGSPSGDLDLEASFAPSLPVRIWRSLLRIVP